MANWRSTGEVLDKRQFRLAVKKVIGRQTKSISKGRSSNRSGYYNNIPIEFEEGDSPPHLVGQPHLMTTFRRGSFSKTLYTPSTLKVVVGRKWKPEVSQ